MALKNKEATNREDQNTFHGSPRLSILQDDVPHVFVEPSKRINDAQDMAHFLRCKAYTDIVTFLLQLNRAIFPSKLQSQDKSIQAWEINSSAIPIQPPLSALASLIGRLEDIIAEAPLDSGPQRFGNISFRTWYAIVEQRLSSLLRESVADRILDRRDPSRSGATAEKELSAYLLGSFGSAQRLDYGTGHELSFLAFLGCLWKLGAFSPTPVDESERALVLYIIEPYLRLVRRLILTYNLEPAGSHGVWGLDDHSFIPYIFGSAQLGPPVTEQDPMPVEGSSPDACSPSDVTKVTAVERERKKNMYFSAIGFIYDVKKGPFWEHSSTLYNISGIQKGWGKINKGMIKMYDAEVLSKFPVVQHFPIGSLFSWEEDPAAALRSQSPHSASLPGSAPSPSPHNGPLRAVPSAQGPTKAPWATGGSVRPPTVGFVGGTTVAPWASQRSSGTDSVIGRTVAPGRSGALNIAATRSPRINENSRTEADPTGKITEKKPA